MRRKKRNKKSSHENSTLTKLVFATAIINLIIAIVNLTKEILS